MKQLAGRVAVITGAASGIGRATARHLARERCRLALSDLNVEGLALLQNELQQQGTDVMIAIVDVADVAAVEDFAQQVAQRFGQVDIVINNAGVAYTDPVEAADLQNMHWLMNINFWGVVHGCRAFMPQLQARAGRQEDAVIVNISSIFAMVSMPTQSIYNASKAAVRGFSDALREELRDSGVRVLCVHPGGIQTRIALDARLGDISPVADSPQALHAQFEQAARTTAPQAAQAIVRALHGGRTRLLIGADAKFGDAIHRLWPTRAAPWLSALAHRLRHRSTP